MGSISAMNAISRVIEKHGEDIITEVIQIVPAILLDVVKEVGLSNNNYNLGIDLVFNDDSTLSLEPIDIDTLAERYPDCDVAY